MALDQIKYLFAQKAVEFSKGSEIHEVQVNFCWPTLKEIHHVFIWLWKAYIFLICPETILTLSKILNLTPFFLCSFMPLQQAFVESKIIGLVSCACLSGDQHQKFIANKSLTPFKATIYFYLDKGSR